MNQWVNESIHQQINEVMLDFLGKKCQYQNDHNKTRLN